MEIVVFEPNRAVSTQLKLSLRRLLCADGSIYMSQTGGEMLRRLQTHRVDLVFLRADAPNATWRTLYEQILLLQPWVKTVLLADTDAYAVDAIHAHIHDYLLVPATDKQLLHVLTEVSL